MAETERLVLRRLGPRDITDLTALIRDKMASPYAPYDAQWPTDVPALMGILKWLSGDPGWYGIELKAEGKLVGFATASVSGDGRTCEVGYTVHGAYQNRGIAYEACSTLMREKAKSPNLEKFTAGTADINAPSRALLAKLGFERTGSELVSFAKDENGEPIMFMGGAYECAAEKWR